MGYQKTELCEYYYCSVLKYKVVEIVSFQTIKTPRRACLKLTRKNKLWYIKDKVEGILGLNSTSSYM